MDSIPQQYQTLAKAGIAGGVAAVAAGLLQSGSSPLVPIFVGGTAFALTHFGLTTVEKTQQAALKALNKTKAKGDKKGGKSDKKSDKKKKPEAKEEEPEEEPEEVVETPKKAAKKGKKEAAPQTPKKEAAPKKADQKAAPKAAAKQEGKAAATPKKAAGKAEAGKTAATPKTEAKAPAKVPAKGAAKAEAKKAPKAEAKKPAAAPKTEAAAPSKNKKKKAPKVVEPEPEEEEEEDEEGWVTQKPKPRKVSEKPSKAAAPQADEEEEEEEKEEGPKEETLSFNLPANAHGAIFGEKGNTIARIQLVTNTRVKMPAKADKSEVITIRGTAENIKLAQQVIQDVAKLGYSPVLNPNLLKIDVHVPSEKQGGLIGKSGSNIQEIQKKTDTKITIPRKDQKSNTITIVGPPEGVAAAQEAIKSILASGFSELTHPDHVKEVLSIPRDQTRFLIGPSGKTIQKIQSSSGVKVNIPDTETDEEKRQPYQVISITGPAPNVRAAKNAILMSMQPVEDDVPDVNSPWAGSASYSEDAQWE